MRFLFITLFAIVFPVAGLAAEETKPEAEKQTIVVTGSYAPVALEEADRAVRSIPVDTAARLTSNTVTDQLAQDSSVDLRQRGAHNIQTDVSIRGGTFGQTLVLLDGFRMNDVQSGHHSMDLPVPMDAAGTVELLKGSGSTLYGSDAVGGVVQVLTRPPEWSELSLRGGIGNFGVNQQRVSASYANGKFGQRLSASRDFSTGFIPNRDYRNLSLMSQTSGRTSLGETRVLLAHADKPFGAEQYYGNFNSWERTKTWFGGIRQSFGENMQAGFGFRRHTDLFVLYRDRPQVFTNRHAAESWQGNFRRSEELGVNTRLHWGVEGLHDGVESTNLGTHDRTRGSAYAAVDVRALRRFSFSAGLREEVYGSRDSQLSPSLAAGVWLNGQFKARAAVSRAFRLPTFTDLYYRDPANVGSPDLRPERAWSFEGGLDWNSGGKWSAAVTVFQRRERDGIDYVRRSTTDLWRATNFQSLRFTGVEGTVRARWRGQLLDWSYTGLRGAQDQLAGVFSRYSFNYPKHFGVAGWQGVLPGGMVARARAGAVQRFARDPYGVVDLYLARSRGKVRPFLQVTNVTDTAYQEVFGVPMPGRGIVLGLELTVWQGSR